MEPNCNLNLQENATFPLLERFLRQPQYTSRILRNDECR